MYLFCLRSFVVPRRCMYCGCGGRRIYGIGIGGGCSEFLPLAFHPARLGLGFALRLVGLDARLYAGEFFLFFLLLFAEGVAGGEGGGGDFA